MLRVIVTQAILRLIVPNITPARKGIYPIFIMPDQLNPLTNQEFSGYGPVPLCAMERRRTKYRSCPGVLHCD